MLSIQHLLIVLLLSINLFHPANTQNIVNALTEWSQKLETSFSKFRGFMALDELSPSAAAYPTSTYNDASASSLLDGIVNDIQTKLVSKKAGVVEELQKATETYYKNSVESTGIHCSNFTYDRAKAITTNETAASLTSSSGDKCQKFNYVNLTDNPLLYNIAVSYNTSTAHVPTNVFDGSRSILMVANWSRSLNTDFTDNSKKDKSLKWQYFGSVEGMLKIYPGVKWYVQINETGGSYPVDFFDCRSLPWYLMASACPKSVVLVVDKSGSMTGKRVIIANRTVTEILLTLTENDLFNVVHIDGFASVIDPGYNESLIQASRRNVHRVINLLNNDAQKIANYTKGLRRGLELLETSPNGYAKALFVIGDGLPYAFDTLIPDRTKYNSTRIFAYLIGKEATEVTNMRNMACNNNGYYAHIMTLSDVKENVLKYLPVISRVAEDKETAIPRFTAWTGPHVREILGRAYRMAVKTTNNETNTTTTIPAMVLEPNSLFLTVARAAYNTKPKAANPNRNFFPLLGVLGLDIPITDFERLTKRWSLGTSGYVFMINNNGYVIFHPNFRPTYNGHMKPFYQNTDLDRAEHPVDAISINGHPAFNTTIREKIYAKATGAESKVYNVPDDFKSAFEMQNKYFFKELAKTPYSIAVVLQWSITGSASEPYFTTPTVSSSFVITDFVPWLKDSCPAKSITPNGITIVPYDFCTFDEAVAKMFFQNPICALKEVIDKKSWQSDESCDKDYIKLLHRDAQQSKNIYTKWNTGSSNSEWKKYEIDLAFLLFHSGLLKFYNKTTPRDSTFIEKHRTRAMHDDLFQTTFMYAKSYSQTDLLYFHIPSSTDFNINSSITVTGMVFVKSTQVPVAVSGLQLSYEKLKEFFESTTSTATNCTGSTCKPCSDSNVTCYLLSTNGYIVASNGNASDVGKFLGVVDSAVMQSMLDHKQFSQKLVYDFQGICNSSTGITSFATRLIDPIASFFRSMINVIISISIVVFQSLLTLFWAAVSMAEVNPTYNVSATPSWNSCSYNHNIFSWNAAANPKSYKINSTQCKSNCTKEWIAKRISKTNLIILHVSDSESNCQCSYGTVVQSAELAMNRSKLIKKDRNPPNWKCNDNPKTETGAVCDGANNLHSLNVAVTLWISVFVILLRHYG